MQNIVFFILTFLILAFLLHSMVRARTVVAKLGAEPDPVKVALMQREALITALQAVEQLDESPEQIAVRREKLLQKQRTLQSLEYTRA